MTCYFGIASIDSPNTLKWDSSMKDKNQRICDYECGLGMGHRHFVEYKHWNWVDMECK